MVTENVLSSKWIYKFYEELDRHNIENHALIMMRDGEVLFENYVYPYSADMPHTLFSVTKSIVSTAVGIAIGEGLFSLNSKVIDFFSEYEACESEEWDNLTVRSVLTMQSNKEFSFTQDMTGNYVEMFMKAPFRKEGRGFLYSNNDAHIAAAIVQKTAGMSLVDYLTPRLFQPLGIDKPFWEFNSIGENIGGTGCYLKLRDLAKICRCYAEGGKWNGEQIIPEWWTKEATSIQVRRSEVKEDGYGYLFWVFNGNFSMDGMFGQRVTYLPEHNAVIAGFNACVNDGDFSKAFEDILPKAFEYDGDDTYDERLEDYLRKKNEKLIACTKLPDIPVGKTFHITRVSDMIAKVAFPISLIPRSLTSSFAVRPKNNLNAVSFDVSDSVFTVKWKEEEDEVIIRCGLDGQPRVSECSIKGYPYTVWAYAFMKYGRLNAVVRPLNTLASRNIVFDFSTDSVKIRFTANPSFPAFIGKNVEQSSFVRKSGAFKPLLIKVIDKALSTTEGTLKFKAK